MPKIKTHSGAKKRFFVSKNKKIKHKKAGLRHLLTGMSSNRGRHLRKAGKIEGKAARKLLKNLLPYA